MSEKKGKILNPLSGKHITVGGTLYKKLVAQGVIKIRFSMVKHKESERGSLQPRTRPDVQVRNVSENSLLGLPNEIIIKIFGSLDVPELINFTVLGNHNLKALATHVLYTRLKIQKYDRFITKMTNDIPNGPYKLAYIKYVLLGFSEEGDDWDGMDYEQWRRVLRTEGRSL